MSVIGEEEYIDENVKIEEEVPEKQMPEEEYRDNVIDTGLAMQQFLVQPTAEEMFDWITKDMAITYLDEIDIEKVRQLCYLINTLQNMGLYDSAQLFYGDLASLLVSARARHGFERQMQQTSISKGFQYFDAEEERKRNMLGGK